MAARIERRRYPRYWDRLGLRLHYDKEEIETQTRNISGCGVYCQIDRWLPLMTRVKVRIILPLKKIVCSGVVVRIEQTNNSEEQDNQGGRHNIAIFFNELRQSDRKYLIHYLKLQITRKVFPGYSGN